MASQGRGKAYNVKQHKQCVCCARVAPYNRGSGIRVGRPWKDVASPWMGKRSLRCIHYTIQRECKMRAAGVCSVNQMHARTSSTPRPFGLHARTSSTPHPFGLHARTSSTHHPFGLRCEVLAKSSKNVQPVVRHAQGTGQQQVNTATAHTVLLAHHSAPTGTARRPIWLAQLAQNHEQAEYHSTVRTAHPAHPCARWIPWFVTHSQHGVSTGSARGRHAAITAAIKVIAMVTAASTAAPSNVPPAQQQIGPQVIV